MSMNELKKYENTPIKLKDILKLYLNTDCSDILTYMINEHMCLLDSWSNKYNMDVYELLDYIEFNLDNYAKFKFVNDYDIDLIVLN